MSDSELARANLLTGNVAQVDGELWDLERPFEKSASLELFDFESPEGSFLFDPSPGLIAHDSLQESECGGTLLPTFWENAANVTTELTSRSALLPTKVSTTRWE